MRVSSKWESILSRLGIASHQKHCCYQPFISQTSVGACPPLVSNSGSFPFRGLRIAWQTQIRFSATANLRLSHAHSLTYTRGKFIIAFGPIPQRGKIHFSTLGFFFFFFFYSLVKNLLFWNSVLRKLSICTSAYKKDYNKCWFLKHTQTMNSKHKKKQKMK